MKNFCKNYESWGGILGTPDEFSGQISGEIPESIHGGILAEISGWIFIGLRGEISRRIPERTFVIILRGN